jgi:uncharacterized protein with GYD domain
MSIDESSQPLRISSLDSICSSQSLTTDRFLRGPETQRNFSDKTVTKGANTMARYVTLIQFADQGIRNIRDTVKRGDAAAAEAEKMGLKIIEEFWTMGAYDAVVVLDAPNDETVSAFMLKIGSLGNVKSHTMRAFRREEMEGILAKIK